MLEVGDMLRALKVVLGDVDRRPLRGWPKESVHKGQGGVETAPTTLAGDSDDASTEEVERTGTERPQTERVDIEGAGESQELSRGPRKRARGQPTQHRTSVGYGIDRPRCGDRSRTAAERLRNLASNQVPPQVEHCATVLH